MSSMSPVTSTMPTIEGKKGIVLLGGGKHCKVVIDVLEQVGGYRVAGISDLPDKHGMIVLGDYRVNMNDKGLLEVLDDAPFAFVSYGEDLELRSKLYRLACRTGYDFPVLVSPSAYVSSQARLEPGSLVGHRAVINPSARIGINVILNTGSVIEHDCIVGDHSHVAPGAVLCGGVQIGQMAMVGAAAVLVQNILVGENCVVGAASI